jgi:hypothetical protein
MKKLILIFALIINLSAFSQDDKTVTLVVSGQGKTQDEAKQNALRSAIEQAFGTFISSKTEILNDNLVKDEIVSISNGNIQKFDIISEVQIPNGGYASTLKATVSVTKLTSFVESKGVEVEFKGSLFGANLRQQKLNEEAEFKAILNLCETSNEILSNSLDYSIEASEPKKAERMIRYDPKQDEYQVLFTVKLSPNKNFDEFIKYFYSNIKSISMAVPEIEDYKKLNKETYYLKINETERYFFRNPKTVIALQNLFIKSNKYLHNFKVLTNLDTFNVKTCCYNYQDNLGTQNIYYDYGIPKIWHLNSGGNRSYKSEGSQNENSGFPIFNLLTNNNAKISSWRTYFEYLHWLGNNNILFDVNKYFTETGIFYRDNGKPVSGYWPEMPYLAFPGININYVYDEEEERRKSLFIIGEVSLTKTDYYCTYLSIFSEDKLSKISNISVKPIK